MTELSASAETPAAATPTAARWLLVLTAVAIVSAACPLTIASPGFRITLSDLVMGAAFLGILYQLWRDHSRLPVPWPVLLALTAYAAAALGAGSGRPGAVEVAQRLEQLFAGLLVFAFLVRRRPNWTAWLIGLGLALNVGVAWIQIVRGGFGPNVTGLFGSRMAFGFWLALALAWVLPFLLAPKRGWRGAVLAAVLVFVSLATVTHGQMLLLAALVAVGLGFLHSLRAAAAVGFGLLALALVLASGPAAGWRTGLATSLSPFRNGRLKQAHVELVAATRMALAHPWTGVGPGHYQTVVGTHYGELPNPNVNAIETDAVPGFGVLFGSIGLPAAAALLLLLWLGACRGLERFYAGERSAMDLAAAGVLLAALAGSLLSDPLLRGVGWFPGFALAAVFRLPPGRPGPGLVRELGWRGITVWCAGFALAAALLFTGTRNPVPTGLASGGRAGPAPALPGTTALSPLGDVGFFRILDAADAAEVTPPMAAGKDPFAARDAMLEIPDNAGKPPDDEAPDMKYGGARFDIEFERELTCHVWIRVLWTDACGNTLCVQFGDTADPISVGNDGTYGFWHWLQVPGTVTLPAGPLPIRLLNREDGICFDQMLITGDLNYVPQGIEGEFE